MITLKIYKAQGIGEKLVQPLTIITEDEIPDAKTLEQSRRVYADQAKLISDALFKSLPGGTIDALLLEMLSRKASLLIIPHVLDDVSYEDIGR